MIVHDLDGCAPTPLAHYLKALGILRLVAEQADPQARGWWEVDQFRLATQLDRKELETFFLTRYEPTPIFNPWGARSGFYSRSSEKSARSVLTAIEKTSDPRFSSYKLTVETVRHVIGDAVGGVKPKDDDIERLILALRNTVRGKSYMWIDSVAAVVKAESEKGIAFPALFGTGGSEGSGSYTSAYMAAIEQCLLLHKWDHAISGAMFGDNAVPGCDWDQSMGQFMPSGAATPWDLLFAFEGACVVRSAVTSRGTTANNPRWVSSPFFVAPTSHGYVSGAELDEYALNKGKRMPGRGEQWFPLWNQPMLCDEMSQMFVEGRAVTKRSTANDGWSMVRAVSSLGVRRGIREFVRFGYQQRNNLATHFAVPLGRFRVPDRNSPRLSCLDDLDAWLPRLRHWARDNNAPSRLKLAERRLADALFAVVQHPDEPNRWQSVLLALAEVEAVQVTGSGYRTGPVPKLRPEWVEAANDDTAEFRLALSFALQARAFSRDTGMPLDPIRRHWLPLDQDKPWKFATTGTGSQTRLQTGSDAVIQGRRGIDDAVAMVGRRMIEGAQRGERRLPLQAATRAAAHPTDLGALIAGAVDMDRTLALGRALMALDRVLWPQQFISLSRPQHTEWPDDAWFAIRLAMLPWPLPDGRRIGVDPAILRRLESGDAATAVELALRRLRAAGIHPTVRVASISPETARLWAAALAFPISQHTATAFVRRLDPHSLKEAA
jgi:CRISPR-associated protein Csx17